MNALATELQTYFTVFARTQRDLSGHTITAYRDTWRMLITFLAARTGTRAESIDFTEVDADNVSAFLTYLEHERGNSVATRNARLCAIRAVLTHALLGHLEHAATISRVLAIPPKRHPKPLLEYLTADESDALIAAPDRTRWTGRHDHALLVLAIQTGLRVSELCSLTRADIHLGPGAHVTCTGKGRRKRATPLTPTTTAVITAYLHERATRHGDALFSGPHGQHLSPDALEHRLRLHVTTAASNCASLTDKHVTMHTLRHTTAMNLLAGGVCRHLRHRPLAGTPTDPIHRRIPARRHGHQASSDRPHPAGEHPTRCLPPRTQHPRLARNPMNMPTTPATTTP